MKKQITLLTMLALSISLMACSSKKEIVKEVPSYIETLSLRDFNAISCSGIAHVHFTQGNKYSVRKRDGINIITDITVRNHTLVIETRNRDRNYRGSSKSAEIWVTAPHLNAITISGVSKFDAPLLQVAEESIKVSGVCHIKINQLKSDKVNIFNSGVGSFECNIESKETTFTNSGTGNANLTVHSDCLKISNSGTGKVNASFKGDTADFTNKGTGYLFVKVDCKKLTGTNSGIGKFKISGTADDAKINASGLSKIDTSELNHF